MAQRSSRKGKGRKKQPELRTGGGRRAKAERSREREAAGARTTETGPAIRMRPAGAAGLAFLLLLAWLGVAAVAVAGLLLDRWYVVGYPDSLWLFVAIGCVVVAPAVGRLSRSSLDPHGWGAQSLLVPMFLFVAEAILGPKCPVGADCAAVGARGALGVVGSLVVILVLAMAAWALARWMYGLASYRRPAQGRVGFGITTVAFLTLLVFPGSVLAATLLGADLFIRDTPELAERATTEVDRECFGLSGAPQLVARPAPAGYNPLWTTFAVRRADEDRPGVGRDSLPRNWTTLPFVHPYEATISFNQDHQVVSVTCRRIGPGTGNAVAADLARDEPDSNPLSPKNIGSEFHPRFFTQGVAGPSEQAKEADAAGDDAAGDAG